MYCRIIIGGLLISYAFLSSCSLPAYSPNKFHAPLLQKQGNIQIEGSAVYQHGFDFGAAYALTDHIGVKTTGGFNSSYVNDSNFHRLSFFEGGAGIFGVVGEKNPWECYLSASYGTSDLFGIESLWESDRPLLRVRSRYLKYTLQSDIMISAYPLEKAKEDSHDAFIDMGLGMRLSYVDFLGYEIYRSNQNPTLPKEFYAEFVTISKYGEYPFFLEFQFGINIRLHSNRSDIDYYSPVIASLGLNFCFF
jgi:hypothetical protein